MTTPNHVAIVGCGFAGTSAFFQLVDRHPVKQITIFEATGDFGPGYPYRLDECPDYLLNNTSDTLCLVPSNLRAFVTWLKGRPDLAPNLDEKGHLPRWVYGAFLKDAFAATCTVAAIKGINVSLVSEEVTALRETASGRVILRSASGEVEADAAVLTTGRCPEFDPYPHPTAPSRARYFPTHIRTDTLDSPPLDATVHVLGASLSAYDVINRLFSPQTGCAFERVDGVLTFRPGPNGRRVVLCSRTGGLKHAQSRYPRKLTRRHFTPAAMRAAAGADGLRLTEIAAAIQRDADANGVAVDWQSVSEPYAGCTSLAEVNKRAGELLRRAIAEAGDPSARNFLVDLFSDARIDIWDVFGERVLATEDEKLYREKLESSTLGYAAPCPVSTLEKLAALHAAGRLSIVRGVREVTFDADADEYRIAHDFGVERALNLVNTTSRLDRDVNSAGQPELIRDLARQGLLHAYDRDGLATLGASVDMKTLRAEGSQSVYLASMLLWGPGFFTSGAFILATVIERLLAGMFAPTETATGQ